MYPDNPLLRLLMGGYDIATLLQQIQSPKQQTPSPAQRYPFRPPQLQQEGGGWGESPTGVKGTAESGKLSGGLATAIGAASLGKRGVGLAGMLGLAAPSLATTLSGVLSPFAMVSIASSLLGGPQEMDPAYGLQDVQSITDTYGAYAGERAAAENAQAVADFNARIGMDETGYGNYSTGAPTPGGWGGLASAPEASVANPDQAGMFGNAGGVGPGNSDTAGTADSTGGARGGEGSDRARGGVDYATRPRTTRWGEPSTGGETAIFIPNWMRQPGVQGREGEVKNALLRALMMLRR